MSNVLYCPVLYTAIYEYIRLLCIAVTISCNWIWQSKAKLVRLRLTTVIHQFTITIALPHVCSITCHIFCRLFSRVVRLERRWETPTGSCTSSLPDNIDRLLKTRPTAPSNYVRLTEDWRTVKRALHWTANDKRIDDDHTSPEATPSEGISSLWTIWSRHGKTPVSLHWIDKYSIFHACSGSAQVVLSDNQQVYFSSHFSHSFTQAHFLSCTTQFCKFF